MPYPIINAYQQNRARVDGALKPRRGIKTDMEDYLKHPPQDLLDAIDSGGIPERQPVQQLKEYQAPLPRFISNPIGNANGLQVPYNGDNSRSTPMPVMTKYGPISSAYAQGFNQPRQPSLATPPGYTPNITMNGAYTGYADSINRVTNNTPLPSLRQPVAMPATRAAAFGGATPGTNYLGRPAFMGGQAPTLNDNATLDERSLAAAQRLQGTSPSALSLNTMNPTQEFAKRGLATPGGAPWALQGSQGVGSGAPSLATPPSQVAANQAAWQNQLAMRQANVQANGIARGQAQQFGLNAARMGVAPGQMYAGMLQNQLQQHQMNLANANQQFLAGQQGLDRQNRLDIAQIGAGGRSANPLLDAANEHELMAAEAEKNGNPARARQLRGIGDQLRQKALGSTGGQYVSTPGMPSLNQPPTPQSMADAGVAGQRRWMMDAAGKPKSSKDVLKDLAPVINAIPDTLSGPELQQFLTENQISPDILDHAGSYRGWGYTGDKEAGLIKKIFQIKQRLSQGSQAASPPPSDGLGQYAGQAPSLATPPNLMQQKDLPAPYSMDGTPYSLSVPLPWTDKRLRIF